MENDRISGVACGIDKLMDDSLKGETHEVAHWPKDYNSYDDAASPPPIW